MQRGRCFYSDIPMECLYPHSDWRMSLERINNRCGHTRDNCVLIANEFNTPDWSSRSADAQVHGTAQWSRAKVADVHAQRNLNVDRSALITMVGEAYQRPRRQRNGNGASG